ncbi:MAG: hypothetical protein H7833_19360 [Magnetococcus sp. DMHC-1]
MDASIIITTASLLLVVLSVVANAYWVDAVRWEQKREQYNSSNEEERARRAVKYRKRAEFVFRVATFLSVLTILSVFLVYLGYVQAANILVIGLLIIAFFLFCYYTFLPRKWAYISPVGIDDYSPIERLPWVDD